MQTCWFAPGTIYEPINSELAVLVVIMYFTCTKSCGGKCIMKSLAQWT